jgi:cell cycle checkpoint protein
MSRRRSSRKAAEVIDLVSSSDEEDELRLLQLQQRQQRGAAAAAAEGVNQLPSSMPSPPLSPATTISNPLANLLAAASSKPPSARPPPSKTATAAAGKTTKAKKPPAAARKRKDPRGNAPLEQDADLDLIDSPPFHRAPPQPTAAAATTTEMWSLKYEPRVPEDLIVHKKKVDEVNLWLQIQLHAAGSLPARGYTSRLLIVTGPPGCGKTTTLRVLGESLGFSITEWQAQAEASYQEINYLNNSGNNTNYTRYEGRLGYTSKIGAFEEFTSRAKMPALPLSTVSQAFSSLGLQNTTSPLPRTSISHNNATATSTSVLPAPLTDQAPRPLAGPMRPTMVFIDDLPFTSDPEQRRRLARAISNLAKCARFPVVLFATEASGRSQQDRSDKVAPAGLPKELASALEAIPGVSTISFNPVTAINTAKCLREILKKENRTASFPEGHILALAEQSDGDLRNAINSLQFACTGVKPVLEQPAVGRKQPASKRQKGAAGAGTSAAGGRKKKVQMTENDVETVAFMLRDTSLGLFHGLGKLLYNKRLPQASNTTENENGDEEDDERQATTTGLLPTSTLVPVPCSAWLERKPMDGFNPDDVLTASGLEATSVNAFLQENLPHFIQDSEIFDLAMCLGQLSTSDILSSAGQRRHNDMLNAGDDAPGGSTIADACAAMVAARGVCFWNTHPAPRQWQPLKGPALYTVQRGITANSEQLHDAAGVGRVVYGGSGGLDSAGLLATELLPAVRSVCQNIRAPYTAPASLVYQQPAKWTRFWNGKLHETVMHAGVGGRGTVVDVENSNAALVTKSEGGGGGSSGVAAIVEEDPIEDSDDERF